MQIKKPETQEKNKSMEIQIFIINACISDAYNAHSVKCEMHKQAMPNFNVAAKFTRKLWSVEKCCISFASFLALQ